MKHGFPANDRVTLTLEPDGVAQLRLARPGKLNALDDAMFDALIEAGHALFDMPGLRCVVLAGEGKGFCAGLDLASFQALAEGGPHLAERIYGNANRFQHAAIQWRKLQVPVIAAVHGVCFGGGLQIASAADIRVAAPDARLAVMEMKWGLVPDMGGFTLWRGVVRDDALRELTYAKGPPAILAECFEGNAESAQRAFGWRMAEADGSEEHRDALDGVPQLEAVAARVCAGRAQGQARSTQ